MSKTSFSPADRIAAIGWSREDLYSFSRWMFLQRKGYLWQKAAHHKLICDVLMRVYQGKAKRLIINVPPRYSKTELAVVNFIAWCFGRSPDCEFIHASYSSALAVNNSANVRGVIQHEAYAEVFPGVALASDAQHHWKTEQGGVMYATGAGGTITGFGAGKLRDGFGGAIIIDDPHKADEANSGVMRKNVIDWFQNTVESRKNSPDTPIIIIMQRLHEEDLAGWLLGDRGPNGRGDPVAGGNGEVWDHLCLSAWNDDGTPLWPEKHSAEDLARMEKAAPYVFAGQYRQTPTPPSGGTIQPDIMPVVDAVPAGSVSWVRGWDLGASTSGDFTAGVKIGKLSDGRFIIADCRREQYETNKRDALIKNTADGDGMNKVRQSLPQDPGQAGKSQVVAFTKLLAGHSVRFSPESGDKVTRATPLASQINAGNVLLLRGEWNRAFTEECRYFPFGKYDDQVDAASRAFNELNAMKRGFFG
ncbi:phage terminase large subunit [Bordetella avium]|uniref:phage terminase large subunit n=1 Tax=Bordetella avium TaxID=521 RepID=UPI001C71C3E0|nr:phage terminase large subunit [Bordetella avium]